MKKFIVMLLAVAMVLSCTLVLASCGNQGPKPELNIEDAAENLEDADYTVMFTDDEDDLYPWIEAQLYATNDDDEGIYITVYKDSTSAKLALEDVKVEFNAEIDSINEKIDAKERKIKQYENILKKYEDDLEDEEIEELEDTIDDLNDEIDELKDELKEIKEEACFGRSGKTVWYGTKTAAKDSKG